MNKSLVVVAKKTKEVLHKMAAGLCTVYRLKETILAHSMISIKPACGDEATSIHIKKVGVHSRTWNWISKSDVLTIIESLWALALHHIKFDLQAGSPTCRSEICIKYNATTSKLEYWNLVCVISNFAVNVYTCTVWVPSNQEPWCLMYLSHSVNPDKQVQY